MATEKQLAANRRNALKSTGPRTKEGKLAVRRNALRHGFFSTDAVVIAGNGHEDQEGFLRLIEDLIADLQPVGRAEELIVENIAVKYWRLGRVVSHETGLIARQLDEFLAEAMVKYQPMPASPEGGRSLALRRFSRPPMEFVRYGDEVTENDLERQKRVLEDLSFQTLEANDTVHRFVWREKLDGEKELPHDWRDRTSRYIRDLSPQMQGKLLRQVVDLEEQIFAEMVEAYEWSAKYNVVSRLLALPGDRDLEKIAKFEAHLERGIYRALGELRELQKRRQGT